MKDWRPKGYWAMVLRVAFAMLDAKPALGGDLAFWCAVHVVDEALRPSLPGIF